VCSTVYHPSGETVLPCYLIKIAARVLASSRIIELWFEAWWSSSRCLLDSFLFFRWRSSRYWKISIWVDSMWKIGTKFIGSPVWSLSCGIKLLGWSQRDWFADCSSSGQLSDRTDWRLFWLEDFCMSWRSARIAELIKRRSTCLFYWRRCTASKGAAPRQRCDDPQV
jgi:hypothetical protein